jgi:PAS domain S-box-containing protein
LAGVRQKKNAKADPFKLLVQSIVDYAIYMLDLNGFVTSWNAGAERIKGFQTEEIVGKHFSTFYTEEDRKAGMPQKVLDTARAEGKFSGEGWRVRKDGSRFWASVVVDRINDENGELIGFAKITRDMTEQREAQHALLEAERRFRILVQGVTDYAIFMLDPEGKVANWNAGAQRIKGYSPEDIVGQHFSVPMNATRAFPIARSRWRGGSAATKPKDGACARTAPASGQASSSTRSTTTTAS